MCALFNRLFAIIWLQLALTNNSKNIFKHTKISTHTQARARRQTYTFTSSRITLTDLKIHILTHTHRYTNTVWYGWFDSSHVWIDRQTVAVRLHVIVAIACNSIGASRKNIRRRNDVHKRMITMKEIQQRLFQQQEQRQQQHWNSDH